jgi:hypothetical protein
MNRGADVKNKKARKPGIMAQTPQAILLQKGHVL